MDAEAPALISPDWCRTMARYNAWQNGQIAESAASLTAAALSEERGAFFGSILGTLNHVIWGDRMWMARWSAVERPSVGVKESVALTTDLAAWQAERTGLDQAITDWAEGLTPDDLAGDLTWFSGTARREISMSRALLITHFFNHQTHHRGQIHAMLTAAGAKGPVSDLFLLPA